MSAPTVLRIVLDRGGSSPFYGCDSCPLSHDPGDGAPPGHGPECRAADRPLPDYGYHPAPDWCPLRTGPVTVEAIP